MKTRLALIVAATGLSLAGCAKHEADNAAAENYVAGDATVNETGGDLTGNDAIAGENALLPADEGNGAALDANAAAAPAGNAQ